MEYCLFEVATFFGAASKEIVGLNILRISGNHVLQNGACLLGRFLLHQSGPGQPSHRFWMVSLLLLPTSTTLFFLPSDAVDGMVSGWAAAAAPASSPDQIPYLQRSQASFERCLEPLIRPK